MKILFDEGVPHPLRKYLVPHQIDTVVERGWDTVQNGKLLKLVEDDAYDLFLTADKNMGYQQTLAGRSFAVIVLSTNHWPTISQHTRSIADALEMAVPGRVVEVDCGHFTPDKNRPFLE